MKNGFKYNLSLFITFTFIFFTSPAFGKLKLGLVLDKGGVDDKSFNASAYKGALQARDRLRMEVKYVEATDDNAYETLLRGFAEKKYDLIIAVGIGQASAVKKVAAQYPNNKFVIIDSEVNAPNVRSLLFKEHEGSYLVGAIAALMSKSGKIGFIGGMDIPLIRRFQMGYEAGAKKINPKTEIFSNYIGVTSEAWNNPPKAKEIALSQYGKNADVIFAAAGASGIGLFDAAEEKKKFAIGVDSNQNWVKPGFILTSMMKRVDTAVFLTCDDFAGGAFTSGTKQYGLMSGAIDYSLDEHNKKLLSKDIISKIDKLKEDIVSNRIKVPDYYLAPKIEKNKLGRSKSGNSK